MKQQFLLLCVLQWAFELLPGIAQASDYYTAGVVEFRQSASSFASQALEYNLQGYLDIIYSPEAGKTDIIIFPECTLNKISYAIIVPNPEENMIPCTESVDFSGLLAKISCAARKVQKYIVVNVKERAYETSLQAWRNYNTNVVFDREGRVISRYRKWHIYLEPDVSRTPAPEYAIFETDFGVRFGHFICFDLLFHTPAQELVTKYGVHDIIFTTMFFSELPFLTATQLQQGWAWGNNVNFLAAGASLPRVGSTGSGIYAGDNGALVQTMEHGFGERKLLVARVPKWEKRNEMQLPHAATPSASLITPADISLLRDPQLDKFTTELLPIAATTETQIVSHTLCQGMLCCQFDINMQSTNVGSQPHYRYRIGVFNGQRSYQEAEMSNVAICAVYACTNDQAHSCGDVFKDVNVAAQVKFNEIKITGNFEKRKRMLLMPTTLNTQLYALGPADIKWSNVLIESSKHKAAIELQLSREDLLTFGIYCNYYNST